MDSILKTIAMATNYDSALKFVIGHLKEKLNLTTSKLKQFTAQDVAFKEIFRDLSALMFAPATIDGWTTKKIDKLHNNVLGFIKSNADGENSRNVTFPSKRHFPLFIKFHRPKIDKKLVATAGFVESNQSFRY